MIFDPGGEEVCEGAELFAAGYAAIAVVGSGDGVAGSVKMVRHARAQECQLAGFQAVTDAVNRKIGLTFQDVGELEGVVAVGDLVKSIAVIMVDCDPPKG